MDPAPLALMASDIWVALQPYLPLIAAKAAEKVGSELPAAVGKLWQAIQQKFASKPAAAESAIDLLKDPENEDVQGAFRLQLKKALETDDEFRAVLENLLAETAAVTHPQAALKGDGVIVQGSHNLTAGPGGVINLGDVKGDIQTGSRPSRRRK